MPRLLIKSGGVPAQWIELKAGINRLGRSPANDIRLNHPTVSALHCEIRVADDAVSVRDRGSTNGTLVNGQPVQEATLRGGQVLQLGAVELVLDVEPVPIVIPRLDVEVPQSPALLPDGSLACVNHPAARAGHRCVRCQKVYCDPCLHIVRRVGGQALRLCPSCSGRCEPIPAAAPPEPVTKSVVRRLRKTLKLAFKRKR